MPKKFAPFMAPISYRFVDPDTGFLYQAENREALFNRIVSYREQNKLTPILYLEEVLEHYLCELPENCAKCTEEPLRRGLYQYLRGGIALIENLYYGKKNLIEQEQADARAAICVSCPQNVFPDKTDFLLWSDLIAEASTGGRKSSLHDKLGNCNACSCCLRAKVFFKGPFKLTASELAKMPSFCWQKIIAESL